MKRIKPIFLIILFIFVAGGNVFAESAKVAIVKSRTIQFYDQFLPGFKEGLNEAGKGGGVDEFDIEDPAALSSLKSGDYAVVCALGTGAAKLVKKEMPDKPLVFSMILNPVASKVVDTMAAGGGNVAGVALDFTVAAQMKLLKKILPAASRVGVVYSDYCAQLVEEAHAAEQEFGITIVGSKVDSSIEVPAALKNIGGKIDVLWLIPDLRACTKESLPYILEYATNAKIPVMAFAPYLVKAGGLFCYTYNYTDIGKQTAEIAAKIIGGTAAGSIPVAIPRKIGFVLNTKIISNLGIKISPDIINEADEVYR